MMELARRDSAIFLSGYQMMNIAREKGCHAEQANIGGLFLVDEDLEVALTHAIHSSNTGEPVGFILKSHGISIYHMGDTAFMGEFSMIHDVYHPDIVMIPIGGRYTMGPIEAAYALDILQPKIAIPIHYNTFEKIAQNPEKLKQHMKTKDTTIQIMSPGETRERDKN
jgi:L-ascorbate metabolism protein UlaG (beta-lactamase superfamily)